MKKSDPVCFCRASHAIDMPPTEEDIAWLKSTFHPIPKAALPDDCIEYTLLIISNSLDSSNDSEARLRLRDVQKYAASLQKEWLKDYIWQRQGFALELAKEDGEVRAFTMGTLESRLTNHLGLSFLQGRTEYGDSIEDEWVIVWLMGEISRKFGDVWIKLTDTDGEFLLIEASGTLPAWLEPDVADNRVWINDGHLKIIKPATAARSSRKTDEKLTVPEARHAILKEPKRMMHSTSMEEEAFYRLRNYPDQIKKNMHRALLTVPRKIAYLLHSKPSYISPAIEAFYLRDPIALKPLNSTAAVDTMTFPPKDLVTVSMKFPRVAYAQLKSQEFPAPAAFARSMPAKSDNKVFSRAETGMKITCGLEMLVTDSQHQDKPAVREMKLLLDDLATGDEVLPTASDIEKWDKTEDDEAWLDIDFNDLEQELGARGSESNKKRDFGDKAAQENLQRIVKQFETFLNDDKAGPDGAGLFAEDSEDDPEDDVSDVDSDDNDEEDRDASFDEDEFSRLMQEMMGMPPEVMKEVMSGQLGAGAADKAKAMNPEDSKAVSRVQELDDETSESGEEDMETMMKQMEAELRGHGALNLKPKTTAEQAFLKNENGNSDSSDDELEDNDIDINLARNLLESFKAQSGTAGPGGNLMSAMGLRLPRDEGDHDDNVAGPSKQRTET